MSPAAGCSQLQLNVPSRLRSAQTAIASQHVRMRAGLAGVLMQGVRALCSIPSIFDEPASSGLMKPAQLSLGPLPACYLRDTSEHM